MPRPPTTLPLPRLLLLGAAVVLLAASCGSGGGAVGAPGGGAAGGPGSESAGESGSESGSEPDPAAPTVEHTTPAPLGSEGEPSAGALPRDARAAAAEVGANELGAVPIIMYHRLLPDGGGDYDLTPEEFLGELRRLHAAGYRPIRTVDLVRGQIDVPAGTTPVVLTFDDGSREQFAYDEHGEVAAGTAIGILLAFAEDHPGFEPVASLYLNASPFGGGRGYESMVAHLHDLGFELGNHTSGHQNLRHAGEDEVRRQLALGAQEIRRAAPGAEVSTMSLPFGAYPEDRSLVASGTWDGVAYEHEGVLLVGAGPAPSPFDAEFDPLALPRIRSSPSWEGPEPDYGSGFWLEWLDAEPARRYVSDGDPDTIAFPEELADRLDPRHRERAVGY